MLGTWLSKLSENPKFWFYLVVVGIIGFIVLFSAVIVFGSSQTAIDVSIEVINGSVHDVIVSYSDPDSMMLPDLTK